eukprot:4419955-Amphidinium_carterae.1
MWKECELGLTLNLDQSTRGDSFFDRKMRALMTAKEDKYRIFDSYLIQRFPLNDQQRNVRGSGHYDPGTQWWSESLIGTLALSPQRELAWATMRTLIMSTPSPVQAEEPRKEERMSYQELADKMSDFYLQYNGDERDVRGKTVYAPRTATQNRSLYEHLAAIINNKKLGVVELQYRLVSLSNDGLFHEQLVQRWHAIGEIIIPRLKEKRGVGQELNTLHLLFQFMYRVMTEVYMKDISHLGGIGQYGDDVSAYEDGFEQLHITDFGNRLYATVIKDGYLQNYSEMSVGFTEEGKGDVLESLMGLNFLEKEHRLTCQDMGITAIDDAQETLLKVEWYTFRKGLEWALEYFENHSAVCGRSRSDPQPSDARKEVPWMRKEEEQCKTTAEPHLFPQALPQSGWTLESGCVHEFFQGARDMKFEHFFNKNDVMKKWWKKRKRAFVVYLTESGHRQWPVGGIWDLE